MKLVGRFKGNRTRAAFRSIAVAAILIVSSFALNLVGNAAAQSDNVKIGINKGLVFLPIWVAKERGLFEKHGVNVELIEIGQGTALRTAILAGSTDMTVQSPEGSAILHKQGASLLNVVATQGKMTYSVVLAAKHKDKFPAGDVKGLKGMTIGVTSRGGGSDMQLQALLKANGLVPDTDVQIVAIGDYSNGIPAMEQGRIDGMMCLEPTTGKALAAGNFELLYFGDKDVYPGSSGVPTGSLAAMKAYIEANPDLVRRVVAGIVEAQTDMVADPDWTLEYAMRLSGMPKEDLEKAVKERLIPSLNPAISEEGWTTLMQVVNGGSSGSIVPYGEAVAAAYASEWAKFKH